MNVKASHSMKISILTAALAFLTVQPCSAQWSYDRTMRRNFWNDGANVSGIRCDTAQISVAGISAGYESGDFRTLSQSRGEWNVNANAKSIMHLDRYSMKGSFSFTDTEAEDMCGSMFLEPGFFPVDVFEFTPGRKTFQTYAMDGGIAVDLGQSWTAGAGLDFTARNAAKRKDLRYSAYRLDMMVNPSVIYSAEHIRLGGTLLFGRNTETVSAEQTGSTATSPFAFFDEGLSLGNWQVWTGNGSRLKESGVNGLPVRQNKYGASAQIATIDGTFYADAGILWKEGSVGERQVIWYRYNGPEAMAHIGFRHGHSAFRAELSWSRLDNRETVQDKVMEGGISIVREYGSNLIFSCTDINMGLAYDYSSEKLNATVMATFNNLQKQATPIYPHVFTRQLKSANLNIQTQYRHRSLEYGLKLGCSKGFATDNSRTVSEGGSSSTPYRHEDVWSDACRYETAGRIDAGATLSWNFTRGLSAILSGDCSYAGDYGKPRYSITTGLNYIF